jgi:hypothetical protein
MIKRVVKKASMFTTKPKRQRMGLELFVYSKPRAGLTHADVERKVREIRVTHYKDMVTHDINCGMCYEFASRLQRRVGGSVYAVGQMLTKDGRSMPNHAFLRWKDKFYDSEAPHGVGDWKDLPFYKRYFSTSDAHALPYSKEYHKTDY